MGCSIRFVIPRYFVLMGSRPSVILITMSAYLETDSIDRLIKIETRREADVSLGRMRASHHSTSGIGSSSYTFTNQVRKSQDFQSNFYNFL